MHKHFISPLTVSAFFLSWLGVIFFYGALRFASLTGNDFVPLFIFLVTTIVISSFVSAYFWEKALIKRHRHTHFSLGSTLLIGGAIFALLAVITMNGRPLLLNLYITVGDFLRDSMGVNIYYLDYSGFALIYLALSGIVLSLVLDFVLLKVLGKKSK
jgi:hypothetical protein